MTKVNVEVLVQDKGWEKPLESLSSGFVEQCVVQTLQLEKGSAAFDQDIEVSVLLTGDEEIQELNSQYRGKNKPTNVLSFPQDSDINNIQGACLLLGDIVLSIHTIQLEALNQNKSMKDHLSHLIVHGTLHLLGYDHQSDQDADQMESLEISILSSMGISNPYAFQSNSVV